MPHVSLAEHFAAPAVGRLPVLQREVSELMTPGVTSIVETATIARVFDAFAAHRVHALLVTGTKTGHPLGWITARGLMAWMDGPFSPPARDAITEGVVSVRLTDTGERALKAMLGEGVTHLLVRRIPSSGPEGVLSERDLVAAPRR